MKPVDTHIATLTAQMDAAYIAYRHAQAHRYSVITRTLKAVEREDFVQTERLREWYHRAIRREWAAHDTWQEAKSAYLSALCLSALCGEGK